MIRSRWHRLLLLAILAIGCQRGGPASDSAAVPANGQVAPADRSATAEAAGPKETVESFLAALFAGDAEQAVALLTPEARKASAEADLELEAPGSPNARFEVTEVAIPEDGPDEAHVWTVLTDPNQQGIDQAYDIVWLLRKDSRARWRVFGMATTLFEERLPLLLNFEDPQDVLAKRQWVRQQYELRMSRAPQAVPAEPPSQAR